MKLTLGVTMLCLIAVSSEAGPIVNGGFESGLSGWTVGIDSYASNLFGTADAGTVTPSSSLLGLESPLVGTSMAILASLSAPSFPSQQAEWDITLSQQITLSANELLTGSVLIYNGDYIPQEQVWVRILDSHGDLVAQPYSVWTGSEALYQTITPWTSWAWQSTSAGQYTLMLGITTRGDNQYATYAGFDAIRTPEPTSLSLLAIGVGSVLALRFRRRDAGRS